MNNYSVVLSKEIETESTRVFDCLADDANHAEKQAEKTNPGYKIDYIILWDMT